jgi:hypothetical protein
MCLEERQRPKLTRQPVWRGFSACAALRRDSADTSTGVALPSFDTSAS